jgi:hypothetical protein
MLPDTCLGTGQGVCAPSRAEVCSKQDETAEVSAAREKEREREREREGEGGKGRLKQPHGNWSRKRTRKEKGDERIEIRIY